MVEHYNSKLTIVKTVIIGFMIITLIILYILIHGSFKTIPQANDNLNEQITSLINKPNLKIEIIKPVFQGYNTKSEKYILNASSAVKDSLNNYQLKNIVLNYFPVTLNKKDFVHIVSKKANFNEKEHLLQLTNSVNAKYCNFDLEADEMIINLKERLVNIESKVKLSFKGSEIIAGKLNSNIDRKILSLGNEVHTKIHLQDF